MIDFLSSFETLQKVVKKLLIFSRDSSRHISETCRLILNFRQKLAVLIVISYLLFSVNILISVIHEKILSLLFYNTTSKNYAKNLLCNIMTNIKVAVHFLIAHYDTLRQYSRSCKRSINFRQIFFFL